MTTEQIFEAYRILKSKGVKRFGIHAFLASNTVTNEYYPQLAKQLFELAVKLEKETGADIAFINLSGGVGIPYRPDQEPNDILAIGEGVRKVYEEVLVANCTAQSIAAAITISTAGRFTGLVSAQFTASTSTTSAVYT